MSDSDKIARLEADNRYLKAMVAYLDARVESLAAPTTGGQLSPRTRLPPRPELPATLAAAA